MSDYTHEDYEHDKATVVVALAFLDDDEAGAFGRILAHHAAQLAEVRAKLDELGVMLSAGRDGALDEMPAAYKDLDVVMEAQTDLVRVDTRLRPIGVIKG